MALQLRSERQIQALMLARFIAALGLNDVNPGSVVDVLTQASAQEDFSLYYQIAQVSRLSDIDSLTGDDLENKAYEYGLSRTLAAKSKGPVSVYRASTFVKVSTNFYAGSPSPLTGNTIIDVNDGSSALIGTTGTLILGRGTNNEEEVPYVIAPVDNTNYWRFTLSAPLTKDHAVEETVILKQGINEIIIAGTIITVPATGVANEIKFTTDYDITILSGEDLLAGVEITADTAGSSGNIAVNAISGESAFPTPPFTGARAANLSKFTTGRDVETDDELRDRIKKHIQGLSRAVKQAILNAIVGLVDSETAKRVVSASVVLPVVEGGVVKIYIDDGGGLEPSFQDIGYEDVKVASGGEQRLQIDIFPIAKAQLESNIEEPYDFSTTKTLIYEVGTISETITFNPADFSTPELATAEEVVQNINDKSTILEARTSEIGTKIVITAKVDVNEDIQVTGGTANTLIGFPTDRKETLNLYIDDVKLSKDGQTATLDSGNQSPYNLLAVGAFPHTLVVRIDGKTANSQTATITTSDVVDQSAVTAAEMVAVINRDIAGIKATTINSGTRVRLQSLTLLDADSKIQILSGNMNNVTNGLNFNTNEVVGRDGDYSLNRELGIVQLTNPMTANQSATAGSIFTRAKLRAAIYENYAPTVGQTLVIQVDGGGSQTITFDASFASGLSAQATANYINATLLGATAIVRQVASHNYLEIATNTQATTGSIIIKNTSTANGIFSFSLETLITSYAPTKAYQTSVAGPFSFVQDDAIVAVVDNDIVNNTFNIPLNYNGVVSLNSSTTVFRALALVTIFPTTDYIKDFYIAFKTGANTTSGTITTVANMGGGTARYTFNPVPGTLASYGAGNLAKFTNLGDSENNGSFVITAVGADYVEVINASVINASAQTGTCNLSQRRQITAFNSTTGQITVGVAFGTAPSIADTFITMPSTVTNLTKYINNTKITSFSLKGIVEGVTNNTKLQLSSQSNGSDGYIQITGGNGNLALQFSTSLIRGLQAYNYWTGLVKLVHKTVYGDDTDLDTYPGIGAAGVTFQVLAPTVRNVEVEVDVTLSEGLAISAVENQIKSVISEYINTLGLGDDVIVERIRAAVIGITGVIDVVINSPVSNIVIADNERANTSDPNISIG